VREIITLQYREHYGAGLCILANIHNPSTFDDAPNIYATENLNQSDHQGNTNDLVQLTHMQQVLGVSKCR
jgi:hypothetical protein